MPTVSSQFLELYAPGLRKVTFEAYNYLESQHKGFIRVGSSERQYEEDYKMGGFGAVPVKPEGTNIIYDDPIPGSKVRFDWVPRGKGFRVTKEAMDDDLYGPMNRMAQALGRAFRNQVELIAVAPYDNAFTAPAAGANNSGYDGLALCDLAHPLLRGGTFRNEPTVPVDLSHTALQDGLIDFGRWVDESGVPIVIIPRRILLSPEQIPLYNEITGGVLKPFTADNTTNTLKGVLNPVLSHFKSVTTSWFILGDDSDIDVWLTWRTKFMTDAADDFDSGDGKIKAYMRLGTGYGDARGVWGSPGA